VEYKEIDLVCQVNYHPFEGVVVDSLKRKVEEALLHFQDMKNEVLSLFGFYNELAVA